jgi:hypothetical protein
VGLCGKIIIFQWNKLAKFNLAITFNSVLFTFLTYFMASAEIFRCIFNGSVASFYMNNEVSA